GHFYNCDRRGVLCVARRIIRRQEHQSRCKCDDSTKVACQKRASGAIQDDRSSRDSWGVVKRRRVFAGPVNSSRLRRIEPPASENAAARCPRRCRNNSAPTSPPMPRHKTSERPELFSTATKTPADVCVKYLWSRSARCGSSPSHWTTCSYFTC